MTNQTQSQAQPAPASRRRPRRAFVLIGLALVFLVAAGGYGAYWYLIGRYWVDTADAYVHGNRVTLMPQIAGTVTAVRADDTEFVHKGAVLVRLDRTDAELKLAHAKANLAQTVRDVHQRYQQEAEQQATVQLRRTQLAQAKRDYDRARRLLGSHNISRQQYQHDRTAWQAAQATLRQARHRLAALQAVTQGTDLRHHPQVQLAVAGLREAYVNLQRTRILAPVSGYVAQRTVQVGEKVSPGQPLLAIVPLDQLWIMANFKETDLARMRIGQSATVTADFYGSAVHYHGKVLGISPGTGSEFELLPPQNATGNWIKVIRRVPVRIGLPAEELAAHPLRLGLSMQVDVDVRDSTGPVLGEAKAGETHYSTDVYDHEQRGLQQLVNRIIRANAGNAPAGVQGTDTNSGH